MPTFESRFVTKKLKKSPNLVTLVSIHIFFFSGSGSCWSRDDRSSRKCRHENFGSSRSEEKDGELQPQGRENFGELQRQSGSRSRSVWHSVPERLFARCRRIAQSRRWPEWSSLCHGRSEQGGDFWRNPDAPSQGRWAGDSLALPNSDGQAGDGRSLWKWGSAQ